MTEWVKVKESGYETYTYSVDIELRRGISANAEVHFTPADGELAGSITIGDVIIEGLAGYGSVYDYEQDSESIEDMVSSVTDEYASELRYVATQLLRLAEQLSQASDSIPDEMVDDYIG